MDLRLSARCGIAHKRDLRTLKFQFWSVQSIVPLKRDRNQLVKTRIYETRIYEKVKCERIKDCGSIAFLNGDQGEHGAEADLAECYASSPSLRTKRWRYACQVA